MLGIVTEYNPFHNGHKLHIDMAKSVSNCNECVVVMSGNFMQRGEPAFFDKYLRTKMALLNGADIVLELPTIFSTASAELFCIGAVDILDKSGIVTKMCFGSEDGSLKNLLSVSKILVEEPDIFKNLLSKELKDGLAYPKAREIALCKTLGINVDFLKFPNNILSVEYLKALHLLKSNIIPMTIKRTNLFHAEDTQNSISSATAIRKAILRNDILSIKHTIPDNCFPLIEPILCKKPPTLDDYIKIIKYILKTTNANSLKNIAGMVEGLENKFISNIDFYNIQNLILSVKSKRYTYSKIQRLILYILLNITKLEQDYAKNNLNQYIKVLGFKKSSSHILNFLVKNAKVPVVINTKNAKNLLPAKALSQFDKNIKYDDIYHLNCLKNKDYTTPISIIE